MLRIKSIFFYFILFAISYRSLADGSATPYAKWNLKHRVSAGYVISFYKNHPQMTADTKRKAGFNICYKSELLLGRKTNLMAGLEFMSQGIKFKGYYNVPSFSYLFDETFAYTHEIRWSEVQMPLALKVNFNSEKEKAISAYYFFGIGARYLYQSYVVISNDSTGITPADGKETTGFEHQGTTKNLNAFYHGGLGIQKNYRTTGRAMFIEFTFKYGISRIHYEGHLNSNYLNIKNNNLAITIGFRV